MFKKREFWGSTMFVILWFEVVDEALASGDKRVHRPEIALRPMILTSLNVQLEIRHHRHETCFRAG